MILWKCVVCDSKSKRLEQEASGLLLGNNSHSSGFPVLESIL